MSKFVSTKLKQIDLGDGDWVKIPTEISFADCEGFVAQTGSFDQTLELLLQFMKEWNLKDEDGKDVELSKENVKKLTVTVISIIQKAIADLMPKELLDKKKDEIA